MGVRGTSKLQPGDKDATRQVYHDTRSPRGGAAPRTTREEIKRYTSRMDPDGRDAGANKGRVVGDLLETGGPAGGASERRPSFPPYRPTPRAARETLGTTET